MEPDEWLRDLEEPPEVLRSIAAFLADRAGFDPETWDADQERAARATVVEVPAGHLLPAVRPHARAGIVEAMFAYRPQAVLPSVEAPIVALVAADDEDRTRARALGTAQAALAGAGRPAMRTVDLSDAGHNLMRYRPAEVTRAILSLAGR
jgi:pimeloyl-ACP methyl ester carboxylesterase